MKPAATSDSNLTESSHTGNSQFASVLAGIVRTLATNTSLVFVGVVKSALRWWFRVPVKLFRPYAVNPWLVFHSMAKAQGSSFSLQFVHHTLRKEGIHFFSRNAIPLFIANAAVGITLFNAYSVAMSRLSLSNVDLHPFMAGCIAGASQSILATPLDAIQKIIHPKDLVQNHHHGIHRITKSILSQVLPTTMLGKLQYLYRHWQFNTIRDAGGFSLFFGVFEGVRKWGRVGVAAWMTREQDTLTKRSYAHIGCDGLVTVFAGAAAGAAYQGFTYPLDQLSELATSVKSIQPMHSVLPNATLALDSTQSTTLTKHMSEINSAHSQARFNAQQPVVTLKIAWRLVRQYGISRFFQGIQPQLIRAMPPSAAALFIYQLTEEAF
ncbi:hypothetical protein BDV3_003076 [Batrachochytrium dendrobatidis]|nr:hypothetical protein O5D80_001435 [Batrachochytrium dendrobatidis]KAK5665431.1 hypothetical protein QVD99_007779 [Batrachochytrium dendrobatidis]